MLLILFDVYAMSMLKLKSPVIIISLIPVSTARYIESSIDEKYTASALGGL